MIELNIAKILANEYRDPEMIRYANHFTIYHSKRFLLGYLDDVVCYCRKYAIFESDEPIKICSNCKILINNEIDEFYSISELVDVFNITNNGVYERVKLILFLRRHEILGKTTRPDAWYLFIDKLKFGHTKILQVVRAVWSAECGGCLVGGYGFHFNHSDGASDKKYRRAIKICHELYPDIFKN